jgi:hypothetical protein
MKHLVTIALLCVSLISLAQTSTSVDSVAIDSVLDIATEGKNKPIAFYWADSIANSLGVPPQLVYEIGMNESRWPHPENADYLIKDGDLQVIGATFSYWYKRLELSGGKTRYNYLVIGINYLNECYRIGGSWRKARYIYGRGRWKEPSQWTKLERHFMNKIDWTQYDG